MTPDPEKEHETAVAVAVEGEKETESQVREPGNSQNLQSSLFAVSRLFFLVVQDLSLFTSLVVQC